jgi:peptidyl-prolyl cis-trans isomerase D
VISWLRKNINNPIILIAIAMITVVFIFTFGSWGGSDVSGSLPMAATVNGRVISEAMFNVQYSRQFQNKQLVRRGYTREDAQKEGLRDQVLDDLIDRELLAQVAEDRGLVVSDDEVVKYIKDRFFGADREFDREEYTRIVNGYYQTSEARFEAQVRRDILADRMQKLVEASLHVSDGELREEFDSRYNRADLELVRVDPLWFKDLPKPLSDEVDTWAAANGEAIEKHYNEFINRYRKDKRVKARHILIKAAEDATEEEKQKARGRAEEARKRVTDGGEEFAKVAEELSEDDGSKKNGGDLGTFGKGRMVKPFEDAAFALKAGDISQIVESRFGFHVIKVEEVLEPEVQELDEVRKEIAEKLMREGAQKTKAEELARNALAQLKEGKALEELEVEGLELPSADPLAAGKRDPFAPRAETTGWFAKNARYVPRVGVDAELVKAAFELTKEAPVSDRVFTVSKRLYVIRLKDRERADPAKFTEERTALSEGLLRTRRAAVVEQFLNGLRDRAAVEKNAALVNYES